MDGVKRAARLRRERDRDLRSTTRSTGVVTAVVDATHVWVNVGSRQVKATLPASVGTLAVGSQVVVRLDNESVVESKLASVATGALWAGKLPSSPGTLTASAYTSLDMSSQTRNAGGLVPTFTGHCLIVPETRPWSLDLQIGYNTTSTSGDRLAGFWLNPPVTTWASSSTPSSGSWLRVRQVPAGGASTSVAALWRGVLNAGGLLMPIGRATAATGVSTNQWDTELTIEAR